MTERKPTHLDAERTQQLQELLLRSLLTKDADAALKAITQFIEAGKRSKQ